MRGVTEVSWLEFAATALGSVGLATGITLRVLHRRPYAPMLALFIAGAASRFVACVLRRDWTDACLSLVLFLAGLGMLTWDARNGAVR
jgi:hypothetical protein